MASRPASGPDLHPLPPRRGGQRRMAYPHAFLTAPLTRPAGCFRAQGGPAGAGAAPSSPLVLGRSGFSRGSFRRESPVPSLDAERQVQADYFTASAIPEEEQGRLPTRRDFMKFYATPREMKLYQVNFVQAKLVAWKDAQISKLIDMLRSEEAKIYHWQENFFARSRVKMAKTEFTATGGDTVTPGIIVAIVSKSEVPAETHVAPSEEATQKESPPAKVEEKSPKVEPPKKQAPKPTPSKTSPTIPQLPAKEQQWRVPMPRLRKRIANRLKDSQNTFTMLTTFNEVEMTNLMKLRSDYKDEFVKKHGVRLGLMSCFVKAAVSGLQNQPIGNDVIDIAVVVGTSKGLVVPVIRDADTMNFADIEKGINNLARKATLGAL